MNRKMNDDNNKFTMVSILKGLGILIPILGALIGIYTNLMVKLSELEMKINFGTEKYLRVERDIKELKQKLENHIDYAEQTYYRKEDEYPIVKKRK